MTLLHRVARPVGLGASSLLAVLVIAACAGAGAPSGSPVPLSADPNQSPATSAVMEPTPSSEPGRGVVNLPTACYGLGEDDCRRISAQVASLLTADPPVRYVQVGPFGCPGGQACPRTLAARQEGDVTLETANGAISFHVKLRDGIVDAQRQETFGLLLQPSTRPPLPAGGQPFTLGHCGLWSGIDLGGSWWDPVGYVDSDHGDAINAATGTIVLVGPDRALFTSTGGFAVQLVRRDGDKYLPFCD